MIIDCSDCLMRDIACSDCVVTVLLGAPGMPEGTGEAWVGRPPRIALEQEELGAMDVLAQGGLVPALKLVVNDDNPRDTSSAHVKDAPGNQRAG